MGLSSELSMEALVIIGELCSGLDASNRDSADGADGAAMDARAALGGCGGNGGGGGSGSLGAITVDGGGGLGAITVDVAIEARFAAFFFAKNLESSSALP